MHRAFVRRDILPARRLNSVLSANTVNAKTLRRGIDGVRLVPEDVPSMSSNICALHSLGSDPIPAPYFLEISFGSSLRFRGELFRPRICGSSAGTRSVTLECDLLVTFLASAPNVAFPLPTTSREIRNARYYRLHPELQREIELIRATRQIRPSYHPRPLTVSHPFGSHRSTPRICWLLHGMP